MFCRKIIGSISSSQSTSNKHDRGPRHSHGSITVLALFVVFIIVSGLRAQVWKGLSTLDRSLSSLRTSSGQKSSSPHRIKHGGPKRLRVLTCYYHSDSNESKAGALSLGVCKNQVKVVKNMRHWKAVPRVCLSQLKLTLT